MHHDEFVRDFSVSFRLFKLFQGLSFFFTFSQSIKQCLYLTRLDASKRMIVIVIVSRKFRCFQIFL